MRLIPFALILLCCTSIASADIVNPNRFIQFERVDFGTSVLTLRNYGTADISLDGWRFCSHDEDQVRRYSAANGLNGFTIAAGQTFNLHLNNDATGTGINASVLGGEFAAPFDQGPAYAISLYYQTPFNDGNNIADHLQWSIGGANNDSADERSDEAENGGVWADQDEFISVAADSQYILLRNIASRNELNSAADYIVGVPEPHSSLFCLMALGSLFLRRRQRAGCP